MGKSFKDALEREEKKAVREWHKNARAAGVSKEVIQKVLKRQKGKKN